MSSDDGEAVAQVSLETGSISETSDSNGGPADYRALGEARSAGLRGGERNLLQSAVLSGGTSPAKKRKSNDVDESECGNR